MKSGQLVRGRALQSLITLGPGQVQVTFWILDKYGWIKKSVSMMHVNTQVRRLPSNSCQHTFSKRELYTSIKCPVVAVWCPSAPAESRCSRGQQWVLYFKRIVRKPLTEEKKKCFTFANFLGLDGRLLDFRMASIPGYQMFKNPRQMTMVSIKSSSTAHQGESCSALHSPDLSVIQQACHVRADLLSMYDRSKNETHKTYRLWTCQLWQVWVWKLHTEWKGSSVLVVVHPNFKSQTFHDFLLTKFRKQEFFL